MQITTAEYSTQLHCGYFLDVCSIYSLLLCVENSKVDRPIKQLKGFQRITLASGETKNVSIEIPLEKLKWYNPVKRQWELENMIYQIYVGDSSAADQLLKREIRIPNETR